MTRGTDVAGRMLALVGIVLLSPLFFILAAAIKLEGVLDRGARGPVLFRETRISRGEVFSLLKFRTLTRAALDSLGEGPTHIKHIERAGGMTGVGRFLTRFYLDELPQLINIVKGDMALIGTRPWPIELYEQEMATGVTRKRDMPAGLLGPVQAHKGDDNSPDGQKLDAQYFEAYRTWPWPRLLWLDLKIMARCLKVMAEGKGL
ncbi:MAG: sugar transferase [Actinobacteria bacterium]|nr:sugar transferase [Actinomycetota bacterium]